MTQTNLTQPSLADRELELAVREAELNRREAALRRAGIEEPPVSQPRQSELEADLVERLGIIERRERDLHRTVEAIEAQRQRLESVRAEYEARRDGMAQRTRELEAERELLRDERARVEAERIERAEAEAKAAVQAPVQAPVQAAPPPPVVEVVAAPDIRADAAVPVEPVKPTNDLFSPPRPAQHRSPIDEWWSKQLGSPLEAA